VRVGILVATSLWPRPYEQITHPSNIRRCTYQTNENEKCITDIVAGKIDRMSSLVVCQPGTFLAFHITSRISKVCTGGKATSSGGNA